MKRIVPLYIAWLGAIVMLSLAVSGTIQTQGTYPRARYHYRSGYSRSHAGDFYTALRWVCCAAFIYSAIAANKMRLTFWTWLFAVLAITFNPIVPFYLQRQTWQIIDYAAIVVIALAAIVFTRNARNRKST